MMNLCCEVLEKLKGKTLVTAESLTGGGIGLMRGARDHLAAKLGMPVKASAPISSRLMESSADFSPVQP